MFVCIVLSSLILSVSASYLRELATSKRSFNTSLVQVVDDPRGRAYDNFGRAVAVYNDVIVVGAPEDSDSESGRDSGRIFVFRRNPYDENIWDEIREIEDGYPGDFYGYALAMHTDYTCIVGAPRSERHGYAFSGIAFYLTIEPEPLETQMESIVMPITTVLDQSAFFGYSVAISEDSYGNVIAAIGAYGQGDGGTVFIYTRASGGWSDSIIELSGSDCTQNDFFGYSIALSGNNMIVGAPKNRNYGAAYVYELTGGSFIETVKLQQTWTSNDDEENPLRGDYYGNSVALGGNYYVVGSYLNDARASNSGAVFVYINTDDSITLQQTLFSLSNSQNQRFGYSVCIDPVYNKLAIGSDTSTVYNSDGAGCVDVYKINSNGYFELETSERPKVAYPDEENDAYFGESVSMYGDTLVVGATRGHGEKAKTGDVYVYNARTAQEIKDYYEGVQGSGYEEGVSALTLFSMVLCFSILMIFGLLYSRYTVVGDKQGFSLYLQDQASECCGMFGGNGKFERGIAVPEDSSHSDHPMMGSSTNSRMSKIARSPMDDSAERTSTSKSTVRTVGGAGKIGKGTRKFPAHDEI